MTAPPLPRFAVIRHMPGAQPSSQPQQMARGWSDVVTLNGTVKSAAGKARAVAIAKGTDRVPDVKDNLKVG